MKQQQQRSHIVIIINIIILYAAGKDIKDVDIFCGKKFEIFLHNIWTACIELLTVA